jgi:predicted SnoaL-like aldol condensation-catalyzing enzyme
MRVPTLAVAVAAVASFSDHMAMAHPTTPQTSTCSPGHPTPPWVQQKMFEDFLQRFYIKKDAKAAIQQTMAEDYIQHNPYALSGRQNAIGYIGPIFEVATFTILRHSFSNGTGWVHTKMEIPGQPLTAVMDIFRFKGTCIIEHWDVATTLPVDAVNPLALF